MNFFSLHDVMGLGDPSFSHGFWLSYQWYLLAGDRLLRNGWWQRAWYRYHQRSCPDEDGTYAHGLVFPQYRMESLAWVAWLGLAILWLSHTLVAGAAYLNDLKTYEKKRRI